MIPGSGDIPEKAKEAKKKVDEKKATKAEEALAKYANWEYHGYAASSYNIEIAGSIDFKDLENISKTETPVLNVLANNVRGKVKDGASVGLIRNLDQKTATNTVYGLFRNIGGSIKNVNFRDNTIRWKSANKANTNSGLIGQLAGGMESCTFTNTVLTGGGDAFGVIGSCIGDIQNVTATNTYVESDGTYVGGTGRPASWRPAEDHGNGRSFRVCSRLQG